MASQLAQDKSMSNTFQVNPFLSLVHKELFYKELLFYGLTKEEISNGPDNISDERLKELKLYRRMNVSE